MTKPNMNVHEYMIVFQAVRGHPPTLAQIATGVDTINHRSSARYSIRVLEEHGLAVKEDGKWAGTARRYRAVSNGGKGC